MAQIRVTERGHGMHPSETVVGIPTSEGQATLIVDRKAIVDNLLEVGYPVAYMNGCALVELPQETVRGDWRVWIKKENIVEEGSRSDFDGPRD